MVDRKDTWFRPPPRKQQLQLDRARIARIVTVNVDHFIKNLYSLQ